MACIFQKRDTQPSHGDRALRRRCHLPWRRHQRSPFRERICLSGYADHGCCGSHPACLTDFKGKAFPGETCARCGEGIFLLRQSGGACHRLCEGDLSSQLCSKADGDRGGHGGSAQGERDPGEFGSRRLYYSAWRQDGKGRLRRRHRFFQSPYGGIYPGLRRGSAERQRAHGAENPEIIQKERSVQADQKMQRFRRGRRVGGHRRAGGRPCGRPGSGAEEICGPGRHGACHLRIPGAHGGSGLPEGCGSIFTVCGRREPGGCHCGGGDGFSQADPEMERQGDRQYLQSVP